MEKGISGLKFWLSRCFHNVDLKFRLSTPRYPREQTFELILGPWRYGNNYLRGSFGFSTLISNMLRFLRILEALEGLTSSKRPVGFISTKSRPNPTLWGPSLVYKALERSLKGFEGSNKQIVFVQVFVWKLIENSQKSSQSDLAVLCTSTTCILMERSPIRRLDPRSEIRSSARLTTRTCFGTAVIL